jgi:inorganic pyrophosphatase
VRIKEWKNAESAQEIVQHAIEQYDANKA